VKVSVVEIILSWFCMGLQCEKLKKKRSSLVGAFVSTHGKSIDDVDRSIVEARYVDYFKCGSFSVFSLLDAFAAGANKQ